ncbi:MAG: hypothetical protein LBR66_04590 [Candidatus Symbiothrix sp.]|nr:hypothetical protein [Candidatus Symbiothrix sp.]
MQRTRTSLIRKIGQILFFAKSFVPLHPKIVSQGWLTTAVCRLIPVKQVMYENI